MAKRGQLLNIIDNGGTGSGTNQDETTSMSFLKGADRDYSGMDLSIVRGGAAHLQTEGAERDAAFVDYNEWDTMTARMEENYEITSEARDYNNAEIDDSKSEIQFDDECMMNN